MTLRPGVTADPPLTNKMVPRFSPRKRMPGTTWCAAPTGAVEKEVVVCISLVGLQEIVVDVLHRQLGLDPIELHRRTSKSERRGFEHLQS